MNGASRVKRGNGPMFHIEITGTITKHFDKTAEDKNAGKTTKLTLYKAGEVVATKHVDWTGGTYKLVADIPESEKNARYELVVSSPLYKDKVCEFTVYSSDKSPYALVKNPIITKFEIIDHKEKREDDGKEEDNMENTHLPLHRMGPTDNQYFEHGYVRNEPQ
ncbi:hypothetical protein Ddc_22075 [Ditylenchus destructor]|nr:hypothetical protein Ddc_22075 [Ditylenchus destructor]